MLHLYSANCTKALRLAVLVSFFFFGKTNAQMSRLSRPGEGTLKSQQKDCYIWFKTMVILRRLLLYCLNMTFLRSLSKEINKQGLVSEVLEPQTDFY